MSNDFDNRERDDAEYAAVIAGGCFTLMLAVIIALVMMLCCSCRSKQEVVREVTVIETHDSIHYVHDTLYFDVPVQTAQVVTHDSVSVLENDYAVSEVQLNKDGTLSHKLNTKPQSVPVPYDKPVQTKTQVIYKDKRIEVQVPVEKKLTAWEQFRLRSFWALLSLSAVAVCIIFRKPLFSLIRRFI